MRKHENFAWSGCKYAPESFRFLLNGKPFYMPEAERSRIAYLVACGRYETALDELKRALRKKEKSSQIVGKCICFFKEGSDREFYYTRQLMYDPANLQDALRCFKEWKRYIQNKHCVLETGFEVTTGEFVPFGETKAQYKVIKNTVDLSRFRSIKIIKREDRDLYGYNISSERNWK